MPRKKKSTAVSIHDLSIEELNEEIERRHEEAVALEEERAELIERIDEIDAMLDELGSAPPAKKSSSNRSRTKGRNHSKKKTAKKTAARAGRTTTKKKPTKPRGSRKRHRNDTNLVEALRSVLSGTTMGVSEVAEAVQVAGYKTTSPNFRTIVNQTLIKHTDVFTKKSRGQYTAKKK